MTDAKRCDRCGAYYDTGSSRQLYLTDTTAAVATVTVKPERREPQLSPLHTREVQKTKQKQATGEVDAYDLCDDCYTELVEWWQDGGFVEEQDD